MSGSTANLELIATEDAVELMVDDPNFVDDPDDPNDQAASVPNSKFNPSDEILYIAGENTGFVTLTIADLHNQPMPAGSKITFTPSVGGGATPSSFDWPNDNHNGGLTFIVGIKGAKEPTSGVFYVSVETLEGAVVTSFSPVRIIIE
jgi:hypothetical protein